jgi:hypothetical protein
MVAGLFCWVGGNKGARQLRAKFRLKARLLACLARSTESSRRRK